MSELDESTIDRLDSSYTLDVLSDLEESEDIRSDEIVDELEVNDRAEKRFNQTARALERIGVIDSQIENGSVQWNIPENFSYGSAVEQIEDEIPYFSTVLARERE